MGGYPIKVLLIEDDEADARYIQEMLKEEEATSYFFVHRDRLSTGLDFLVENRADVIVVDLGLPDSQGLDTFLALQERFPQLPIVVLSGFKDNNTAVNAVQQGAQDYIVKGQITGPLLSRSLRYAIERKRAEVTLRESEAKYYDLYDNAPDMHYSVDVTTGTILECNKTFLRITGFTKEEIIGRSIFELYHEDSLEDAKRRVQQFDSESETHDVERKVKCKDGSIKYVSLSVSVVRDKDGKIIYTRSTWRDMTERKKYEELICTLSNTDPLTGLYNRRGFMTLAEQQLRVAERTKNGLLLFFADLDDLKQINDRAGHQAGDDALIETAVVLKEVFRKMDIVARVGGDEFAMLAPEAVPEYGDLLRKRLQYQLELHNALAARDYLLSLSVGAVYYDPESPASLDKMMAHADSLMYQEKEAKRQLPQKRR